jgi:hypothetical protein
LSLETPLKGNWRDIMKHLLVTAALAGSMAASGALAGGYELPVQEQEPAVVIEDAKPVSLGSVAPYAGIGAAVLLVALVASGSDSDNNTTTTTN